MCGLVGILGCRGPDEERRELIHAMANTMVHPPEVGITFTGEGGRANANLRVSLSRV